MYSPWAHAQLFTHKRGTDLIFKIHPEGDWATNVQDWMYFIFAV
jgi:hypothetical protein